MSYRSSAPRLQDSDNVLLFKIAQSLNADPLAGDSANDLLRKIAAVAAAATGGGGGSVVFTNGTFTSLTSTNGTFTNLTAVNGTITNLTAPNLISTSATLTVPSGGLLRFGGATASFPALKNSGAELQARLANDSGFANLRVGEFVAESFTSLNSFTLVTWSDASVSTAPVAFEVYHNSTAGTPTVNNGVTIDIRADSSTTDRQIQGQISTAWIDATHATRTSKVNLRMVNSAVVVTPYVFAPTSFTTIAGVNFLINASAAPAGLTGGFVIGNAVGATSDPVAAVATWSTGGEWQYRTSLASEGAGQINRVHNRSLTVTGSGTDYTLTGATARIDFGTTDAEVVLPTAGVYLVMATVQFVAGAVLGDDYRAKLRNSTDAADVGGESQTTIAIASGKGTINLSQTVTITATKTIQLFGFNATAARGTVTSTLTSISFVRLS